MEVDQSQKHSNWIFVSGLLSYCNAHSAHVGFLTRPHRPHNHRATIYKQ